jgi:hypothetical protein
LVRYEIRATAAATLPTEVDMLRYVRIIGFALALGLGVGCGGGGGGGDDDTGDDDSGSTIDADPGTVMPDAPTAPPGCTVGGPNQCNDCVDNDKDGTIDGNDVECTSELDDDEGSFATGLPGDNRDTKNQDCFFDGDSGAGNDGCNQHICCLLQLDEQACQDAGYDNSFDPATGCPPVSADCAEFCAPAAPPGCDCFGCCTICDDAGCVDVAIGVGMCDQAEEIHDTTQCPVCAKNDSCGTDCNADEGGDPCVLCPGEDPNSLPPECNGTNECPNGGTVCTSDAECSDTQYCTNGCCSAIVL